MKKIYTNLSIITLTLLNLCATLSCSEQSLALKKAGRNWLQTKIDKYAENMLERHSYKYFSLEHCRDLAVLYVLPTPVAQYVLTQQRLNMKNFLIKNEADTLEAVREYWKFDQETWADIQKRTKEEIAFNLSEMQKDQTFNTHHDQSLPPALLKEIKNRCKLYGINPNSLNLKTSELDNAIASSRSKRPLPSHTYNPATIRFNINDIDCLSKKNRILKHIIDHELRHAIAGHSVIKVNIIDNIIKPEIRKILDNELSQLSNEFKKIEAQLNSPSIFTYLSISSIKQRLKSIDKEMEILYKKKSDYLIELRQNNKLIDAFIESPTYINFVAALEKTADTFAACTTSEAAKNAASATWTTGYTANFNDMLILNANWKTSDNITKSQEQLQLFRNKHNKLVQSICSKS